MNAQLAIGIALAAVVIDRTVIGARSSRSRPLGAMAAHAAAVPVLLVLGSALANLVSHFVLRPLRLEFLGSLVFIVATILMTLAAETTPGARGKPGFLNRALSGTAVTAVLLGLASSVSIGGSLAGIGMAVSVGLAFFVFSLVFGGIAGKMERGVREKGVLPYSRELVIAGLLALVAVGCIASLHR